MATEGRYDIDSHRVNVPLVVIITAQKGGGRRGVAAALSSIVVTQARRSCFGGKRVGVVKNSHNYLYDHKNPCHVLCLVPLELLPYFSPISYYILYVICYIIPPSNLHDRSCCAATSWLYLVFVHMAGLIMFCFGLGVTTSSPTRILLAALLA